MHYAWNDVEHGDRCECLLLAQAVGAPASSVDRAYCRNVLQKHWRLACNHGCVAPAARATPQLPPCDTRDPVQALLIANAPVPA